MFLVKQQLIFRNFSRLLPLTEVSPQLNAIPVATHLEIDSQLWMEETGFEPRTAGQQSGLLPLSYHASLIY
jgi:hypothetical protein